MLRWIYVVLYNQIIVNIVACNPEYYNNLDVVYFGRDHLFIFFKKKSTTFMIHEFTMCNWVINFGFALEDLLKRKINSFLQSLR
jgi:hypothetical protein